MRSAMGLEISRDELAMVALKHRTMKQVIGRANHRNLNWIFKPSCGSERLRELAICIVSSLSVGGLEVGSSGFESREGQRTAAAGIVIGFLGEGRKLWGHCSKDVCFVSREENEIL